jgi:hypothetical protein
MKYLTFNSPFCCATTTTTITPIDTTTITITTTPTDTTITTTTPTHGIEKITNCKVKLDDGSIIDLTSLDNPTNPRYNI